MLVAYGSSKKEQLDCHPALFQETRNKISNDVADVNKRSRGAVEQLIITAQHMTSGPTATNKDQRSPG